MNAEGMGFVGVVQQKAQALPMGLAVSTGSGESNVIKGLFGHGFLLSGMKVGIPKTFAQGWE